MFMKRSSLKVYPCELLQLIVPIPGHGAQTATTGFTFCYLLSGLSRLCKTMHVLPPNYYSVCPLASSKDISVSVLSLVKRYCRNPQAFWWVSNYRFSTPARPLLSSLATALLSAKPQRVCVDLCVCMYVLLWSSSCLRKHSALMKNKAKHQAL